MANKTGPLSPGIQEDGGVKTAREDGGKRTNVTFGPKSPLLEEDISVDTRAAWDTQKRRDTSGSMK